MGFTMGNSAGRGTLAARILTASFKQTSNGWDQIKYTTEDPHNFEIGQLVTVVGITGGTSANVSAVNIVNIPSPTSFIVSAGTGKTFATGTAPVIGTGSNSVTVFASNGWSNAYELKYATPPQSTSARIFFEVVPNISASTVSPYPTDGTVSVNLNWSSIGGSNPISDFKVTQTVGTTTTDVVATAPSSGSTTVTGLTADTVYTFTLVASNVNAVSSSAASISVPRQLSPMGTITAAPVALTANTITVSWDKPFISSPLPSYYEIQQATSSNNSTWSAWTSLSSTSSTSVTLSGLTSATYYKYRVRAFNGDFNGWVESNSTLTYYITTPMVTPTLSIPSVTKTDITINATGFISNPTITTWTIQRSTNGTTWSTVATTGSLPYTDTSSKLNSTLYYYRIKANNGQLESAYSNSASITTPAAVIAVEYLVIGGGGGGGSAYGYNNYYVAGGGGGAGGLRTNAGPSGGGASAEPAFNSPFGATYSISVGTGGGVAGNSPGFNGNDSIFANITAKGGGGGAVLGNGRSGGSGGGGSGGWSTTGSGGSGTANQGYAGGASGNSYGGGGGGAGAVGTANTGTYQKGGIGVLSSITGSPIGYAGGGNGGDGNEGHNNLATTEYNGIDYGGGFGAYWLNNGYQGVDGKGGGGGGASSQNVTVYGGRGGNGIVVIAYPDAYGPLTIGSGLTYDTPTRSGYRVYRFTAGSGTVTFPS